MNKLQYSIELHYVILFYKNIILVIVTVNYEACEVELCNRPKIKM